MFATGIWRFRAVSDRLTSLASPFAGLEHVEFDCRILVGDHLAHVDEPLNGQME